MIAFQTLLRRTAAALGAIAAVTVTGPATAQTMTLSGVSSNSCAFSTMSVAPNGNVTVTCSSSTSPGTFTLSAVTSLSTNTTNSGSAIKVTRTNGSAGDVAVNFTATGACSAVTTPPLTFTDGTSGAQNIEVSTDATVPTGGANCIVTLTSASAGNMAGSPKTVKVLDPDADVAFAFSPTSAGATVGGGPVTITVTRTGGANGAWSVPYTLAGTLANAAGDALVTGGGSLSGTLSFAASGNQTDTLTYTPPSVSPPGLPANLIVSLGVPTGGVANQNATTGSPYTLNLSGAPVGCPTAQTNVLDLGGAGKLNLTRGASGIVNTFAIPTPLLNRASAQFKLSETSVTWPIAPWSYEIHINKCRGLVQPTTGDKCYAISGNKTLFAMTFFVKTTNYPYDTAANIKARGACYAPAADGPYYINIRYNYTTCTTQPCGWHAQWQTGAY